MMKGGISIQKLQAEGLVWGDWDNCTVRLDFDDTQLAEVKLWAHRAMEFFKLQGFVILRSSLKVYVATHKDKIIYRHVKGSYLVVFDRKVDWTKNVHVMNWVALESGNEGLKNYARMQCIKETSTVRISSKSLKPFPRIVFCYGKQNGQIKKFLSTRKFVLEVVEGVK